MKRVAILLSGGGSNMVKLVESMRGDHPAQPVLVLSNDSTAGGLDRAAELGVPTEVVDHRPFKGDREAFERALIAAIEPHAPDIICLAGFMRILTPLFINTYAGRMLNIHPSLLPKYRGLHTHKRALDAGETQAGCTVHEVTAELDDGPILGQAQVPIEEGDSPETLAARVLKQEHVLYPAVLERFAAGNREPIFLG
ncbi:phosphoribosylglycinamide formyltransferase [Rhodalgimonas zhirmunskyi]|uniref:Phosphoribosylglycinamide formyltransferase n=1 Tax=Rhodalgimonas zhirmunskyi TaxID=2964767 RepID=A0AAJ1X659_9RHOB|nr:phosphoribosylglycinamide formyltransferase [Rhodoalgimonas zhirmunskyi]MDQ2093082.1 phosphoribosylglycinamide formyltransferase [Rhodoalgimonas zhirmunskyi]